MRKVILSIAAAMIAGLAASQAAAQEPVTGVTDAEALFHSPDPRLEINKQAAYHIVKDLLEAGHWEQADRYLTARYIQHNPLAKSGRAGVVDFFTKTLKVPAKQIPARTATPIVAVLAEGDLVTVVYPRTMNADDPGRKYTTTWFDMWRFVDGKADEHWDPATRP